MTLNNTNHGVTDANKQTISLFPNRVNRLALKLGPNTERKKLKCFFACCIGTKSVTQATGAPQIILKKFFSESNQFQGEMSNLFCYSGYANIKSRKSNVVIKP